MTQRRVFTVLSLAATGMLIIGLTGCQGEEPKPDTTEASSEVSFDPKIDVTEASETITAADETGREIELAVSYPDARATGVDPAIADDFAEAVADDHLSRVESRLKEYSDITLAECGEERLDDATDTACARASDQVIENAGVYEEYGTVATRSSFILGSRDRNPQVHAVTMNLRTGETAALEDFLDLGDSDTEARAVAALEAAEDWATCGRSPADETATGYLAKVEAFSPSEDGVVLLWAPDPTATAQCQVDRVVVPWTAPETEEEPTETENGPATADGIAGYWCPTPESAASPGCVTVAPPTASYDDGTAVEIVAVGEEAGGFAFAAPDAPFGTYYPAGVPIDVPDYYPGADLPDQDRLWNGQTGVMMTRH